MQIWIAPLAVLLGVAAVITSQRLAARVALLRQEETVAVLRTIVGKLNTLDTALEATRAAIRNGQEALVVLDEEMGMEFGELRTLLTPKPAPRKPAARKPAVK